MRLKVQTAALIVLALAKCAAAEDEIDITGRYLCQGKAPDKQIYRGLTVITKTNETYQVSWNVAGEVYFGEGIRHGDFLSVCWILNQPRVSGIMVYHIQKGPKLAGKWAVLGGEGAVQPEALTFISRVEDVPKPKPKPRRQEPKEADDDEKVEARLRRVRR